MRMRRSLSVARGPTLACLIFGAACAPTIAQGDAERIHVNLPTAHADQLVSDAENLNLAVTTADLDGLRPEQPGFKAPAGGGECKIYLDGVPPSRRRNSSKSPFPISIASSFELAESTRS